MPVAFVVSPDSAAGDHVDEMAEFLVELYMPSSGGSCIDADADRARRASDELSAEGSPIQYVRSIFVPDEETCFLLFEAETSSLVAAATERAALRAVRVSEAITTAARPKGAQK